MPIDPRYIINSRFGISLASLLGRTLSLESGYRVTSFIADRISARRSWGLVRAVRANQWVVSREQADKAALDLAVRDTFRYIARSVFDLYHYINDLEGLRKVVVFDQTVDEIVHRPAFMERGLIALGLHMSNFDIALQAGTLVGMKGLVLTIPDLHGGYRQQFEMRKKTGMNVLPASYSSIRKGIEHLQAGGLLITGMDRPDGISDHRPIFFGRPAALPIHPVYLAIRAKVPIVVIAMILQPDGKVNFLSSPPIEMEPCPDRRTQELRNAEAVLKVAEDFISQAPQQWAMTLPVWPEALAEMP